MLVLFDIDGTLLLTRRAGARAMQEAGRALFGDAFDLARVELAGRLDPLIWADAMRLAGFEPHAEAHARFRARYAQGLARRLSEPGTAYALPGVPALLDALAGTPGVTLGLLTGNYPETGRMKLEAAGLDPARFPVQAWGADGASRRDLPGVALARHAAHRGGALHPRGVVVVGDTPHDVDCARAHGLLAVAVASGPAYAREDLAAHAPDLLLDDLTDVGGFLAWLERHGAGA
jgi:phosphoglycolate phosphatase-like HAD superfamily hydrolase